MSVTTIDATLRLPRDPLPLPWVSQRLGDSNSLIRLQMLNDLQGWSATSEGILFNTEDGQSWRQIKTVPLPKDAYLTDLFFQDLARGWVSLSKTKLHFNENTKQGHYEITAWLINTTDQGRTWERGVSFEGAQILQILFVSDNEGWAVGRKPETNSEETDSNFIVHTTDNGKTWVNMSDTLPDDTGLYSVVSLGKASVAVITGNGVLYSTTDGGTRWQRIGSYADEYNEVAVQQLAMNVSQRPCILGGSGGIEGTLSVLACGEANKGWARHVLGGVFLNDAIFLADGSVIACGFIAKEGDPLGVEGEAAILKSTDEGKTWSVMYRNPAVKSLNALAATDQHHIWAVGANGLVVRLDPSVAKR